MTPLKGDVLWITCEADEFKEINAATSSNLSDVLLMDEHPGQASRAAAW